MMQCARCVRCAGGTLIWDASAWQSFCCTAMCQSILQAQLIAFPFGFMKNYVAPCGLRY